MKLLTVVLGTIHIMKAGRIFALVTGILYLGVGIMGFIPALVSQPATLPDLAIDVGTTAGYGYLMGLFPVNVLHNVVHLVVGLTGIAASIALDSSRTYARGLAVFYGVLAVMGIIPVANITFGLIPIYGNDVWLHAVTAAIAAYYGFFASPGLLEISARERQVTE